MHKRLLGDSFGLAQVKEEGAPVLNDPPRNRAELCDLVDDGIRDGNLRWAKDVWWMYT